MDRFAEAETAYMEEQLQSAPRPQAPAKPKRTADGMGDQIAQIAADRGLDSVVLDTDLIGRGYSRRQIDAFRQPARKQAQRRLRRAA